MSVSTTGAAISTQVRSRGKTIGGFFLVGGFKYFLMFIPIWGNDPHFDEHIFQMGWFNHQPVGEYVFCMASGVLQGRKLDAIVTRNPVHSS